MTTERSNPRPAEADVADLLKRASGQNLSAEEAKVVAVDANRPAHPKPQVPEDPAPPVESDDDSKQPEGGGADAPGAYEVFDPDGVQWRL